MATSMIGHTGRMAGRTLGWLIGAALLLIVAAQVGFLIFTGWLATPSGAHWLNRTASGALRASGFTVQTAGVHWIGLADLQLDRIAIADRQGVFLDAQGVRLSLGLVSALSAHVLPVALAVERLHVTRLPAGNPAPQPKKPYDGKILAPFQLKQPFVREVDLRDIAIRTLALDAPVAGQAMVLSPHIGGSLALARNSAAIDIAVKLGADGRIAWLPETLGFKAGIATDQARLTVSGLRIVAPAFTVEAGGGADLNQGPIALKIAVRSDALDALSGGKVGGTAHLDLGVGGTTADPSASVAGLIDLASLAGRGLGPIAVKAEAAHLLGKAQGDLTVATTYKNRPATVAAQWRHDGDLVTLDSLNATAPGLAASGRLAYDLKTRLADGTLTANVIFDAYRDLLKADVKGKAETAIVFAGRDGRQAVTVSAKAAGVKYQSVAIEAATLDAAIADARTPWPQTAKLTVTGARIDDIALSRFAAALTEAGADRYALKFNGSGRFRQPFTLQGAAELSGHTAADAMARGIGVTFKTGRGSVTVAGDVLPDRLAINAGVENLALAALPVKLPAATANLGVSGQASITGALANPAAKLDLAFTPVRIKKGLPAVTLKLAATYANGKAAAKLTGTGRGIDALKADVGLPLALTLKPFKFALDKTAPLRGDLSARLDAGALAPALLPPEYSVAGRLDAQGTLAGTMAKPVLAGGGTFSQGRFVSQRDNVALGDIGLRAGFKNNILNLASFSATDGKGGTIKAHGTLNIPAKNAADFVIAVRGLDPFTGTSQVTGTVSADLTLKGAGSAYVAGGTINPGEFNVAIPDRFASKIPQLNIVDPNAGKSKGGNVLPTVALQIRVHAPNRIFVRGWGLDAEFGGDLAVTGTAAAPQVNGNLASLRGRYEEFNKRFTLARANLRFQGAVPPSPYLDIEATTTSDSTTIIIDLTGPSTDPKLALSSSPALPQDEVLSHLLFGKDMQSISPFQAIQLASTVQRLTGHGGGPGILDRLRSETGLDDISVNSSATGDTTVGAGKYITDKVYLQVEGGTAAASSAVNVQYQLTPHLTVNSKVSQDAQAGGGVAWSWDY